MKSNVSQITLFNNGYSSTEARRVFKSNYNFEFQTLYFVTLVKFTAQTRA